MTTQIESKSQTLFRILPIAAIGLLSACGGSDTSSVPFSDVSKSAGANIFSFGGSASRSIRYEGGNPIPVFEDANYSQGAFTAYTRSNTEDYILYYAETADGSASAEVFAEVDDTTGGRPVGALAQSDGGSLPTSGRANFEGDYVGFLARNATNTRPHLTQNIITGVVDLTADFGTGTVQGSITDRERYLTSSVALQAELEDVNLGTHSIRDGGSVANGLTTGGELAETRYPPNGVLQGSWSVAFAGENAADVVGTVEIIHDYVNISTAPDDYVETGAFIASKN